MFTRCKKVFVQNLHGILQAGDPGGLSQMVTSEWVEDSSLPRSPPEPEQFDQIHTDNTIGDELLLNHRDTNNQRVLIRRHLPLLPNYQHMYRKSIPSTYHPTQTFLGG